MSRILPVRTGWDPSPGDADFYPDDLPEDWRLTYFANALDAVALDADAWGQVDAGRIARWGRDVPASFAFYLRHDPGAAAVAESAGVQARLGEHFGGWILCPDQSHADDLAGSAYVLLESVSAAAGSHASALACAVPAELGTDLRAARGWLEGLAAAARGRPALALMGRARFEDVRRWQSLVELLGLS
ncbi:hypothetical protein [Thiocapsa rosea]|uniref:Uncharacterized protein n=1 Tax=Thiocapsa rosea TaxID=69360 RepID=A0A495V2W5_9GAMM|nr:hypothetical protein [Thiocapsa rosea]RKT43742.1 hypothetical protein BDD21_1098 [Thiocapsa rosea]